MDLEERRLQEAIDTDTQPNAFGTLNRALHAVAAHLHRYNTELESMQETLLDIIKRHQKYTGMNCLQKCSQEKFGTMSDDLEHIASHLKQIRAFLQELMDKVQNNLALIANDRGMVANGEKIHAILLATQDEAKSSKEIAEQSVKLSKEMRQDSVAMRTIAVTTMFFLPGTSFAVR
ncbi:MAG: hypothetical protein M1834_001504 [Cirrosporium novae-zelandiae]|nr:MAG: hypothetical protein M1834_004021 [Cirrosporium novae-zelandiae]KAI9735489.1 MAG: hypothetical protein M1834_001504 [Cirrosporium novae-zelandiae]